MDNRPARFNPQQTEAVNSIYGPLLIIAGAGTGKTSVITGRMEEMIRQGLSPESIVAMTFTNKAAREMKERLQMKRLLTSQLPYIGTFHSYCLLLLRTLGPNYGFSAKTRLIGTSDQIDLIKRALKDHNLLDLYQPDDVLRNISRAKNSLVTIDELKQDPNLLEGCDSNSLIPLYDLYERQLKLCNAMDFDDCILKVFNLTKDDAFRARVQMRHKFFLVDEFQDTNFAQLALLRELVSDENNICAVGDDDQSIYSWRGALAETLNNFQELFKPCRLIKLEQNYRCSKSILMAANQVIKHNKARQEKTLWTASHGANPIGLESFQDEASEAKWIANKCIGALGRRTPLSDIAVLYRTNSQARAIELALAEAKINYRVFGGSSFFDQSEVKDLLAYLSLCANPQATIPFWRIVNTPNRGLGIKSQETVHAIGLQQSIAPLEALKRSTFSERKTTSEFIAAIEVIRDRISQGDNIEQIAQAIITQFSLEDHVRRTYKKDTVKRKRINGLHRLPSMLRESQERFLEENPNTSITDFLENFLLNREEPPKKDDNQQSFISLMTIHSAKGLEFPIVFLCGLEEEQLPHKNSLEQSSAIDEERRLFYVAMTRAKSELYLTYAKQRYSGFQKSAREASRFLSELPEEVISGTIQQVEGTTSRKLSNIDRFKRLSAEIRSNFK